MYPFLVVNSVALGTGWNPHLLRDAAPEKLGPESIGCGGRENFKSRTLTISSSSRCSSYAPRGTVRAAPIGSRRARLFRISPLRAPRAPVELPGSQRRPCERDVNRGVNGCAENDVHASIHTSPAGSAGRVRKLCGCAKTATEMSEPGGFARIRSGGRSQRRAARTLESAPLCAQRAACAPTRDRRARPHGRL